MGEWSKKVGEQGENIVAELLKRIGWADAQNNIDIPCVRGQRHSTGKGQRKKHGIDRFLPCQSPLVDRTVDHLAISVKFSASPYPSSPNTKFKEYFRDLAMALECFRNSSLRSDASKQFSGVSGARNVGVLFWLTNDKIDRDILSDVASVRQVDDYLYETIFVVDDYRAAFLFDSIDYINRQYPQDDVEFLYPITGRNINPAQRESSGKVLPVEFVNAPILPFQIHKSSGTTLLALTCIDEFHPDRLRRIIGLAQDITNDFAAETVIAFPDFDQLHHGNSVMEAKAGFEDKKFTDTVKVVSFRDDFRGVVQ